MAGVTEGIRIELDNSEIQKALQKLSQIGSDMPAAMLEISEYLHERTRDHFDNEQEPDGTPWATLSPETLERKQKQGVSVNKILHGETLDLRDTIFAFHSANEAGVSTGPGTEAYAATQQFGDDDRNIVARKYFGLGDEDETEIIDIIHDHLSRPL
ncbi:MAG: phage virion morphogenesis protein [Marinomonas foliarum]|uniref:phage virion morphogenesis protein n=1 Tax=Marinomonas foliarum TaxID=491950 RepID=UPI003F998251